MTYTDLLQVLRRTDPEIHSAVACGSRVYGTANVDSDEDFLVVLHAPTRSEVVFRPGLNVVLQGFDHFQDALRQQSVFALEAFFLPPAHRLKHGKANYTLDRHRLHRAASEKSDADFQKAAKTFALEPNAARKKLFHSLRVPSFARQIARTGAIHDYGETNSLWEEIATDPVSDWAMVHDRYAALREQLCAEILS